MALFIIIGLLAIAAGMAAIWGLKRKKEPLLGRVMTLLGIALLAVHVQTIFIQVPFIHIIKFNIHFYDDEGEIIETIVLMGKAAIVLVSILRWFTYAAVITTALAALTRYKPLQAMCGYVFLPVCFLNIIFIRHNMLAIGGLDFSYVSYRCIRFLIETLLCAVLCFGMLLDGAKSGNRQRLRTHISWLAFSLFCFLPLWSWRALFGYTGILVSAFSPAHIVWILCVVGFGVSVVLILSKKDKQLAHTALAMMSAAAFFQYFTGYIINGYTPLTFNIADLPLHLCNMAMLLIPFALITKNKKVFYFTYFVNVSGAVLAIMYPFRNSDIFSYWMQNFMVEHTYAATLPVIFILLGFFDRPSLKDYFQAIKVFSIFFAAILIFDVVMVNFNEDVDFFYLVGDMGAFVPFVPAIKKVHITLNILGLTIRFEPIYQLLLLILFYVMTAANLLATRFTLNKNIFKEYKSAKLLPQEEVRL